MGTSGNRDCFKLASSVNMVDKKSSQLGGEEKNVFILDYNSNHASSK